MTSQTLVMPLNIQTSKKKRENDKIDYHIYVLYKDQINRHIRHNAPNHKLFNPLKTNRRLLYLKT